MQRKPLQVVYYRYAFDKYGSKPSEKHLSAIEKLQNKQMHSVNHEKLYSTASFDVSSIRYSKQGRLKLTYKETKDTRYIIIIEDADQHQYEDKVADKSRRLADCIDHFAESLASGEFLPLPKRVESDAEEEKDEHDFFYCDGKFIEITTEQEKIEKAELPKYVTGAAGSGKTLMDTIELENAYAQGHNVLYITQRPELAAKVRDIREKKYVIAADAKVEYTVLDYVAFLRLVDPELNKKSVVGEVEFNAWYKRYLKSHKQQDDLSEELKEFKDLIYDELKNLSGYFEDKDEDKNKNVYLDELGQDECLFVERNEKKYLLQLYKTYNKHLSVTGAFDPAFYEARDLSLFEDYIVALDEVDNVSTLQIKLLAHVAKLKNIIISGDNHQSIDDCIPKEFFIKRTLGSKCKAQPLAASKRNAKEIIGFANKLIKLKYKFIGGQTLKDEYPQIDIPPDQHKGVFQWADISDAALRAVVEEVGRDSLIVITFPELLEEARKRFPGVDVSTFSEYKGREFQHIAIYQPMKVKVFAEFDKELSDKVAKEKYHLPKKRELRFLRLIKAINALYVGATRGIERLIIFQEDTHAVRNIINDLRPSVSPSVIAQASSSNMVEKKSENPNDRLNRAIDSLKEGDIKKAMIERENLQEEQKNIFDQFKIDFDKRRAEQAEKELARQLQRKNEKLELLTQKAESRVKPSVQPTSSSSPASKSIPLTGANVKKVQPAPVKQPAAALAPNAKVFEKNKNSQSSDQDDFRRVLDVLEYNGPDRFDHIVDMLEHNGLRIVLRFMSINKPELVKTIPLECLFESSGEGQNHAPIITLYPELAGVFNVLVAKLNDKELAKLVDLLGREGNVLTGDTVESLVVTSVFRSFLLTSMDNLYLLLNTYGDRFARLITGKFLSKKYNRGIGGDGKQYSETDLYIMSQSEEGCRFFTELVVRNPNLLAEIEPEAMFHVYNGYTRYTRFASVFNNVCENELHNVFNDWLADDKWLNYVVKQYQGKPSLMLLQFTNYNIASLVHHWYEKADKPLLKILRLYPEFLHKLKDNGFFAVNAFNPYASIFAMMCAAPVFHSYLRKFFDSDANLYSQISINEFFKREENKPVSIANVALLLTQSNEGVLLLSNIVKARKDIREKLATMSELFVAFVSPAIDNESELESDDEDVDKEKRTCLYLSIKQSKLSDLVIKQLQHANADLKDSVLESELVNRGMAFLTDEESMIIDSTRENLTFNSLLSLLKRPEAARLLFQTSARIGEIPYISVLLAHKPFAERLLQVLKHSPEIVKNVFPIDFFTKRTRLSTERQYSFLSILLKSPVGKKIANLICNTPGYMAHIKLEHLLKEMIDGESVSLFESMLRDDDVRWLLDALTSDDQFVADMINQFFSFKLSESSTFSTVCRYYPTMGENLIRRSQNIASITKTPGEIVFGDSGAHNFYWLSLSSSPFIHDLLLSIIQSQKIEDRFKTVPVIVFGFTLKPRVDSNEVPSALLSLLSTPAGKAIISLYIADPKRANQLLTPALLCKPSNDLMYSIAKIYPYIAVQFIDINPALIEGLSMPSIRYLKPLFVDQPQMLERLDNRERQLGAQAPDIMPRSFLKQVPAHTVAAPVINKGGKYTQILRQAGNMQGLFTKNKNGGCLFTDLVSQPEFRADLVQILRTDPDYFNGVSVLTLFDFYINKQEKIKQDSVASALKRYEEFNIILLEIYSGLTDLESDRWISDLISLYNNKPADELKSLTLAGVAILFVDWKKWEVSPMLRLLNKHPNFVSQLLLHGIYEKSVLGVSVFEMMCQNPQYHPYLNGPNWGKFKQLTAESFFDKDQPLPFCLAQSKDGLQFLYSILDLRLDLRKRLATPAELVELVDYPDAPDGREVTCVYHMLDLNKDKVSQDILNMLKQEHENPKRSQETIDKMLKEKGLDFLTDDECELINRVCTPLNVESLSALLRRPDAQRLLFCASGKRNEMSLLVSLLWSGSDLLSLVIDRYPELVSVFPDNFLFSTIRHTDGREVSYFDVLIHRPSGVSLLRSLEQHDKYFARVDFGLLFCRSKQASGLSYFELALKDKNMHWLLMKMLDSKSSALIFAERYAYVKLSEMNAVSQACKYCPEFVLKLLDKVLPEVKVRALLFNDDESARHNFHWLAVSLLAHERLFLMIKSDRFLLSFLSERNLCDTRAVSFSSTTAVSPLESLVQSSQGRWILRVYLGSPQCSNRMYAAEPKYLCRAIMSGNSQYNGKTVLDVLLVSKDIEGYNCAGLVVELVNCNPALIDHVSYFALAILQDAPNVSVAVVERVNQRLRDAVDEVNTDSDEELNLVPSFKPG